MCSLPRTPERSRPAIPSMAGRSVRLATRTTRRSRSSMRSTPEQQKQAILSLRSSQPRAGPRHRWKDDRARGGPRVDVDSRPAHDARGSRARVGRHPWRRSRGCKDEGDSGGPRRHILCVGRRDDQRQEAHISGSRGPAVLIEYAPQGPADNNTDHIHTDLPRSDERLRGQGDPTMRTSAPAAIVSRLAMRADTAAHRLDEYLQATRLSLARNQITLEIDLTPGANIAAASSAPSIATATTRFRRSRRQRTGRWSWRISCWSSTAAPSR